MDEKRGTPVARRAIIGCQATVVGRIGLRRDCHPISRTHDFRFRGRVCLPIVTNWPRARRIGDNWKTYASLRVRVTQAESTHESTSSSNGLCTGRTSGWLRAGHLPGQGRDHWHLAEPPRRPREHAPQPARAPAASAAAQGGKRAPGPGPGPRAGCAHGVLAAYHPGT
jgi:hypothetical protein